MRRGFRVRRIQEESGGVEDEKNPSDGMSVISSLFHIGLSELCGMQAIRTAYRWRKKWHL